MNQDGMRKGYDIEQLKLIRKNSSIPLIASGGAGSMQDFHDVFVESNVNGALAASVFHSNHIMINDLKQFLLSKNIEVRL
jgi:imidazole glycerol-phosphate synthase subunit HisF